MRKRLVPVLILLAAAGCTDTADTIMLEYRNTNNEALDAMMMVTSEEQAGRMKLRVFQNLKERYDKIDKKLTIMVVNRTKKELVTEMFESDGVVLFFTESQTNLNRFNEELRRLENLGAQYVSERREQLRAQGEPVPAVISLAEVCPNLFSVLSVGLGPLNAQLKDAAKPEEVLARAAEYLKKGDADQKKLAQAHLKKLDVFSPPGRKRVERKYEEDIKKVLDGDKK